MLNWLTELIFALPLLGLLWLGWHALGVAARRTGSSRVQVAAFIVLLGWLIGH